MYVCMYSSMIVFVYIVNVCIYACVYAIYTKICQLACSCRTVCLPLGLSLTYLPPLALRQAPWLPYLPPSWAGARSGAELHWPPGPDSVEGRVLGRLVAFYACMRIYLCLNNLDTYIHIYTWLSGLGIRASGFVSIEFHSVSCWVLRSRLVVALKVRLGEPWSRLRTRELQTDCTGILVEDGACREIAAWSVSGRVLRDV